ncbi:cation transporter [Corynebacterium epidermidicanis]|uniref:Cation efflux family n=1 Tax=Corynebacterium epidermidicanis TaxID=1050174 RepID=A0A0G3GSM5_9CORY|nr:cation transporter [Corynebacterium epidermidicanis]AKK03585.1 Cation efflux family [Corynebacterium epidermidicanis]
MTDLEIRRLTRTALVLAIFTICYNLVEGVLSVWSGRGAGLEVMVGFGLDSFIESLVAILVALRLRGRLSGEPEGVGEDKERITLRLVAVSFVLLAGYLIVEGILGLRSGEVAQRSWLGIAVLVASLVVMPLLWWQKNRVGKALGDQLILSDAAETKICLMMTASALIGIVLLEATGWGGFDALASFVIAGFALAEAKEAWEGELEEDCDCH